MTLLKLIRGCSSIYISMCSIYSTELMPTGELSSGAWGFGAADSEAALRVAPDALWQQLTGDPGRLRWLT